MSEKAIRRRAISQWGWSETMQGKWVDLDATQGPEKPWGKVLQQGSDPAWTEAGQVGGVYKRDETRVEPQRQSVSQAATTCPAISRSALGPIPVSSLMGKTTKCSRGNSLKVPPGKALNISLTFFT